jgi:hypothetical protein
VARLTLDARIRRFRRLCFAGVKKALAAGRQCRSYECSVALYFPSYLAEMRKDARYQLQLSCSLLGRGNHHSWSGRNWPAVFELAEEDVKAWIREVEFDLGERDEL